MERPWVVTSKSDASAENKVPANTTRPCIVRPGAITSRSCASAENAMPSNTIGSCSKWRERSPRHCAAVSGMECYQHQWAVRAAAWCGYLEIMRQCLEWGSTEIDEAMAMALIENHDKIVQLCLE